MATPVSPPGVKANTLYGLSSNQQLFTMPSGQALEVDDCLFLRPDQSEAVLLQFGDLLAVRGDEVVAEWPVLKNELGAWSETATATNPGATEDSE
jgi:D-serine deaminase-like pyridoxal phosphate-dependent protein